MVRLSLPVAMAGVVALTLTACVDLPPINGPHDPINVSPTPVEPPSAIDVPVGIILKGTFALIEQDVPSEIPAWGAWTDWQSGLVYRYDITRNTMLKSVTGTGVEISAPGAWKAAVGERIINHIIQLASCGDGGVKHQKYKSKSRNPLRFSLDVSTSFSWNPDWHLNSNTVTKLDLVDACNVTVLNIPLDDIIHEKIDPRLGAAAGRLDAKIGGVNLKPGVSAAWAELQKPFKISDNLWILMNPTEAHFSPIVGDNGGNILGPALFTDVGITAAPILYYQPVAPTPPAPIALPALKVSSPGNGFHIAVDGSISYSEATTVAAKALVGWEYPAPFFMSVKITDVNVYGSGDQAVVAVTLGGAVKGVIYFHGTPYYDNSTQMLRMKDFDYTAATKSVLVQLADFLLHDDFRSYLASKAVWPIAAKTEAFKASFEKAMNHTFAPGVSSEGFVNSFSPTAVYLTNSGIGAEVSADGNLRLYINPYTIQH